MKDISEYTDAKNGKELSCVCGYYTIFDMSKRFRAN